jgi:hypothetical protein
LYNQVRCTTTAAAAAAVDGMIYVWAVAMCGFAGAAERATVDAENTAVPDTGRRLCSYRTVISMPTLLLAPMLLLVVVVLQVAAELTPLSVNKVGVQFKVFKIFGFINIKAPPSARGEDEVLAVYGMERAPVCTAAFFQSSTACPR